MPFMRQIKKRRSQQRGSALLVVMVFGVVVALLTISMLELEQFMWLRHARRLNASIAESANISAVEWAAHLIRLHIIQAYYPINPTSGSASPLIPSLGACGGSVTQNCCASSSLPTPYQVPGVPGTPGTIPGTLYWGSGVAQGSLPLPVPTVPTTATFMNFYPGFLNAPSNSSATFNPNPYQCRGQTSTASIQFEWCNLTNVPVSQLISKLYLPQGMATTGWQSQISLASTCLSNATGPVKVTVNFLSASTPNLASPMSPSNVQLQAIATVPLTSFTWIPDGGKHPAQPVEVASLFSITPTWTIPEQTVTLIRSIPFIPIWLKPSQRYHAKR